jgi:PAS domain S-box-containing protein
MSYKIEPSSFIVALSAAIKRRRKELSISQEDLSYDAGFARSYLSDVERGSRSFSIKNFARLANCLGIKPSHLMAMAEDSLLLESNASDVNPILAELAAMSDWIIDPSLGLLITDATKDDNPIVYVSEGFASFTGYLPEEIVGRNCRFLQGDHREQSALKDLKAAIRDGRPCSVKLLNYKKNGSPFSNLLSIHPLRGSNSSLVGFIGLQSFVDENSNGKSQSRQVEPSFVNDRSL